METVQTWEASVPGNPQPPHTPNDPGPNHPVPGELPPEPIDK